MSEDFGRVGCARAQPTQEEAGVWTGPQFSLGDRCSPLAGSTAAALLLDQITKISHKKYDIHVHVPAGAIPKDGPSAGVSMVTSLVSLMTNTPVKDKVAMTGEITLRGNVLPIGGVKEKVTAAHRAGIKEVVLPELNRKDLEDVPKHVSKDLTFHFAKEIWDVLKVALPVITKKRSKKTFS